MTTGKTRLLLPTLVAAAMLLNAPAAAQAVDYCVGWTTACPGTDEGTGAAGLQAALTAAASSTTTNDRVLVDAAGGPYTQLHGFTYNELTSLNHVDVIGVSTTQPLITATWDGDQQAALKVASPGGSSVQNLHIDIPNDAHSGYGLQIDGGANASNVTVTGPNPGTGLDDAIITNGGNVTHSTIDASPTSTIGVDVRPNSTDINVTDNTITAARGFDIFGNPAHDAVLSRNLLSVGFAGIYASAGASWKADNDLIDLRGTGTYGIYAGTSPSISVNNGLARNLTIRNGGGSANGLLESSGNMNSTISVTLADSILRDVAHSIVQMTPPSGATFTVIADHDDYDQSTNQGTPNGSTIFRTETNLVNVDPHFVSPLSGANGITGDYRLAADSPVIDIGSSTPLTAGETDLAGQPRIVDGVSPFTGAVRDLGAYEFQPPQPASTPAPVSALTGQQAAALKKCKKIKNPAKRRKCKKRAKRLPL
jgi:hypothetical protein